MELISSILICQADWIEVDKDYEWYIKEKLRVVEEEGKRAVDSLPENDEAAGELLDLVVDYLPKVYSKLYISQLKLIIGVAISDFI